MKRPFIEGVKLRTRTTAFHDNVYLAVPAIYSTHSAACVHISKKLIALAIDFSTVFPGRLIYPSRYEYTLTRVPISIYEYIEVMGFGKEERGGRGMARVTRIYVSSVRDDRKKAKENVYASSNLYYV